MDKNNLSTLNTEELNKKLKVAKAVTGMFAGALIVLFVMTIYLTFTKKFTTLTIMPIALLPLLIVNFNSISKIKSEIKSRENLQ